ncbi:MAG: biotin transporter BioY [Firmicutes bacterium]|nr:biotin transporter BioY [Bacillota bacterium]
MKTKDLVLVSLFAALTAVMAQIAIPLPSGIPITLLVLAVFLSGAILGSKLGFLSQLVYILLGAIGIPVFANFSGGIQVLAGITGGYILSLPITCFIIGKLIEKYKGDNEKLKITIYTLSMFLGLLIMYFLGTLQFSLLTGNTIMKSLKLTVLPFIVADLVKLAISVPLAYTVKNSLIKSKLLMT